MFLSAGNISFSCKNPGVTVARTFLPQIALDSCLMVSTFFWLKMEMKCLSWDWIKFCNWRINMGCLPPKRLTNGDRGERRHGRGQRSRGLARGRGANRGLRPHHQNQLGEARRAGAIFSRKQRQLVQQRRRFNKMGRAQ